MSAGRPTTWEKWQLELLKKLFPNTSNEVIAQITGKTISAVRGKANLLKLKKSEHFWDYWQEELIIENWDCWSVGEISKKVKKTKWAIYSKHRELQNKLLNVK